MYQNYPVGLCMCVLLILGIVMLWTLNGNTGVGETTVNQSNVENFSSCYQRKQIYLNAADGSMSHADVNLERRWGKMFIHIDANLPYALGGVFHTMAGAYHAFLVDSRNGLSINLGSLIRHNTRRYLLSTELLGDYSNYNEIRVYRKTEDYKPILVLSGDVYKQQCSSL